MAAYGIGQAIIFSSCGFFSFFRSSFFFAFSEPSHIGCLRYFHTWCGLSANLGCRTEMCCTRLAEIQDAKNAQNSPSGHHRTNLSGYVFATKAHIDNQKKNLFNNNISPTRPHNMVNFGQVTAEIDSVVSANFNGFRVLVALLHGTLVVGVS